MNNRLKYIISGGGTGGHIFPALSIADELRRQNPTAEILFVGATGKMEMERVPAAGYSIVGLPIRGFDRKNLLKNLGVSLRLIKSNWKAYQTIRTFRPDVVIGVGGYASAPTLFMAQRMGIPTLIQEQNSYAGIANKLLARCAGTICVAYPQMEIFFPKRKLVVTGNPVRAELFAQPVDRAEALAHFGLNGNKQTLLIVGGSLGARTLNDCIKRHIKTIASSNVQVLWQCGGYYRQEMEQFMAEHPTPNIVLTPFIARMDYAFAAADVIVSRAGAGSVSEFCLIGKPVILVPSPNVAEDHQMHNAMSLVNRGAALMITDAEAKDTLISRALALLNDQPLRKQLSQRIEELGLPHASATIVKEIHKLHQKN